MSPRISLLIPTYKRQNKLFRSFTYLLELLRNGFSFEELAQVEILIADGTPEEDYSDDYPLLVEMSGRLRECGINIRFLENSQVCFFSRLYQLVANANSEFVSLLGDEDLFAFDSLPSIWSAFNSCQGLGTVTGGFIDIHGFQRGTLKLSRHEGWLDGFEILNSNGIDRFAMFNVLAGVGISSISYAVMRKSILYQACEFANKNSEQFTYCGFEVFLNTVQIFSGKLISLDQPIYLRDRTFVDRATDEPLWSDPAKDTKLVNLTAKFLVAKGFLPSLEKAVDLLASQVKSGVSHGASHFEYVRSLMDASQPVSSCQLAKQIYPVTFQACFSSWKKTAKIAVQKTSLSHIGLKPFWVETLSSVKRKLVAAWQA